MSDGTGAVQVEKDGVIDYPLYAGQTLGGVWNVVPNTSGPAVVPADGYLHYFTDSLPARNQWLRVSITTPMDTKKGCLMTFRVRANVIQGEEVKFTLAAGVILRFTSGGASVAWQWWNGSFQTLAASSIRADGAWHDVVMAFSPGSVSLFEDGRYMFTWQTPVGAQVSPQFDMQVLTPGSRLSLDVGEIYSVPSTFAAGVDTPWDYSFQPGIWPSGEAMGFRVAAGGPQVSFGDGYVRFAAQPLQQRNTWTFMDVRAAAPAVSVLSYPLRVNASGGAETKVTLPGDNILRLTSNGTQANWQSWNGSFQTLAPSGITAGQPDFTVVTLVTSGTSVSLLENGVFKYQRAYAPASQWSPGLAVQHLDVGTSVSVDVGGVRALPCIKPPSLLAVDLQSQLLAYFSLKGTPQNAARNSGDLVAVGGTPAYTTGPYGLAANFAGGSAVFAFPQLHTVTSRSYTLSLWTRVNGYPPAGQMTGIAGMLLLASDGRLSFRFLYNGGRAYQEQVFTSRNPLSTGAWHNVVVTFSYEEARLGIYVDGAIDSIYYLGAGLSSAIIPAGYFVGGYQAGFDKPLVVLDGAVGDMTLMTQHVHQPTVNMLAGIEAASTGTRALFIPLLVPVFFILLAGVVRVGIEIAYVEQTSPQPPPSLDEVVTRIRQKTGVPANPSVRVSRADLGIDEAYPILLDVGGEGRLSVGGLVTGFDDAINLNAVLSGQGTPAVTVGGPLHGKPIPRLVQLQAWNTNPPYPFVDGFADRVAIIGSPLTDTNVREIARVVRDGGEIDLWVDYEPYRVAAQQLASLVNSVVEEPGEITAFAGNGVPENRPGGTWFVRRRIIAHKAV
jgi:hypothetical protein